MFLMMNDLKPFASVEQQVEILRGRGLELPDEGAVKKCSNKE